MSSKTPQGEPIYFLCATCFNTADESRMCHEHMMIAVYEMDDIESRKPLISKKGILQTRAPRWFLDALSDLRGKS